MLTTHKLGFALVLLTLGCLAGSVAAFADEPQATPPTQSPAPPAVRDTNAEEGGAGTESQSSGVDAGPGEKMPPKPKPVKGFHPLKHIIRPMGDLQTLMEQLEVRIGNLQPHMQKLPSTIERVNDRIGTMHERLTSVREQVSGVHEKLSGVHDRLGGVNDQLGGVNSHLSAVNDQLSGVQEQVGTLQAGMTDLRKDISEVRKILSTLDKDVDNLRVPVEQLREPMLGIAGPLTALHEQIHELIVLVRWVLIDIIGAAVLIAVGTPIALFEIRQHRKRRGKLDDI